jgi:hypothetical protein
MTGRRRNNLAEIAYHSHELRTRASATDHRLRLDILYVHHVSPRSHAQRWHWDRFEMPVLARHVPLGVRALTVSTPSSIAGASIALRSFSVLNRPPPNYPGHVPLTFVERSALAVGSAVGAIFNPYRGGNKISYYLFISQLEPQKANG